MHQIHIVNIVSKAKIQKWNGMVLMQLSFLNVKTMVVTRIKLIMISLTMSDYEIYILFHVKNKIYYYYQTQKVANGEAT